MLRPLVSFRKRIDGSWTGVTKAANTIPIYMKGNKKTNEFAGRKAESGGSISTRDGLLCLLTTRGYSSSVYYL